MIEPILFKRDGINHELYKGVEAGQTTLYFQTVNADEDGLKDRWYCVSLYADTNRNTALGSFNSIKTEWMRTKVSPIGNILFAYSELEPVSTKDDEVALFNTMFAPSIFAFMANGLVREKWGFNHFPVIDTRPTINGAANPNYGQPMVYTEEEESYLPTWDYKTWNTGDPLPEFKTPEIEEPE